MLLLDEPTSHLDAEATSAFEAVVKNLGSAIVRHYDALTNAILCIPCRHHSICDARHNTNTNHSCSQPRGTATNTLMYSIQLAWQHAKCDVLKCDPPIYLTLTANDSASTLHARSDNQPIHHTLPIVGTTMSAPMSSACSLQAQDPGSSVRLT